MRAVSPIAICCLESFNGLAELRAPDSEDSPNISETGDPLPGSRLPSEKFAIRYVPPTNSPISHGPASQPALLLVRFMLGARPRNISCVPAREGLTANWVSQRLRRSYPVLGASPRSFRGRVADATLYYVPSASPMHLPQVAQIEILQQCFGAGACSKKDASASQWHGRKLCSSLSYRTFLITGQWREKHGIVRDTTGLMVDSASVVGHPPANYCLWF